VNVKPVLKYLFPPFQRERKKKNQCSSLPGEKAPDSEKYGHSVLGQVGVLCCFLPLAALLG